MKIVYLAHPYGGDERNIADAQEYVERLVVRSPSIVFLSPLQAIGFCYRRIPYIAGMNHCLELLKRSDELFICNNWDGRDWETSKGCCMEYAAAREIGKPIYALNKKLEAAPIFVPDSEMIT